MDTDFIFDTEKVRTSVWGINYGKFRPVFSKATICKSGEKSATSISSITTNSKCSEFMQKKFI